MKNPSILIIGAGMTGLLMAIKLEAEGYDDIKIIEKKSDIGGTWRENTYPGVACDIPGHLYSYSFELNPEFSNLYPKGEELQSYFLSVCEKYKLDSKIRFSEEVLEAKYQESDKKWYLKTNIDQSLSCDILIAATGILHHPNIPEFKGSSNYQGKIFHTAQWDHSIDLRHARIAFIGTGSTACQAIPEMVNAGAHVSVFQRTPQWIFPLPDVNYYQWFKSLQKSFPWLMKVIRTVQGFLISQLITKAIAGHLLQHKLLSWFCRRNLSKSIKDPQLRKTLTPDYKVGCKRVIVNSTFYAAIQSDQTSLVTCGIDTFTKTGIQTVDGQQHDVDAIVLGTGFDAHRFMRPIKLTGRGSLEISQAWHDKAQTYQSLLIPKFPNFFLMLGPNAPISNYSVTTISEVQSDYILQLIKLWAEGSINTIEPTRAAFDQFNQYIGSGFDGSNWTSGCQSWYLNADGEPIVWPFTWKKWVGMMKQPRLEDFIQSKNS